MNPPDDFWSDPFHWCALGAAFLAASEGRLDDSAYVKELAYRWHEEGAFRDRAARQSETVPAQVFSG
jgi:hypothetical protein